MNEPSIRKKLRGSRAIRIMLSGILVILVVVWVKRYVIIPNAASKDNEHGVCYMHLKATDPVPSYDAYITWSTYDGTGSIDGVVIIWNGKELGKGRNGVLQVVERLKEIRKGSTVLIYPDYMFVSLWEPNGPMRYYPWQGDLSSKVEGAAKQRKLQFVYSPRDHLGNMHPFCAPFEDLTWPPSNGSESWQGKKRSATATGA